MAEEDTSSGLASLDHLPLKGKAWGPTDSSFPSGEGLGPTDSSFSAGEGLGTDGQQLFRRGRAEYRQTTEREDAQ